MQPIKIINIKRGVSKLKYIGEGKICVIDEQNTIRIYESESFKLIDGFKIKLPKNNPLENSVNVSNNGKFVAISVRGKHKVTIWSVKDKKLLYTLGWHKGDILSVAFDNEEKYFLSGGEDGRTYVWSLMTGKMVSTLPPHADYVTTVAFSNNSLWAATGSYDKSITITNIASMDLSYRKKVHSGAVTHLKFIKNRLMISGDKNGELVIWDYSKGSIKKRLTSMVDTILDTSLNPEESFMFAISKSNKKVVLYSLENFEQISDEFIKLLDQPSSIEYIPEFNYLVIGTIDGSIYFYDLYKDEKKLIEYIKNNDYEKAYELININPFLKKTTTYIELDKKWEKIIELAQKKFESGEVDIAKQLLAPFLKVPQKRSFVQSLLNDFGEFEKFKKAVLSKKYPLAYSLVVQYPFLKSTTYYKKMENDWKKAFNKAKQIIFKRGMEDEVREILKPFRGVTAKTPLIQALFNEKQIYALLQQKLMKRDFEDFFNLINRFPFLSDSEEYEKAIKYGESLYQKANELLKIGEYKKVLNVLELLKHFPKYKEEVKELETKAKTLLEFHRVLATNDLHLIETFVKSHPFLEETIDYQEIQKKWKKSYEEAEKFAAKGDIKNVLEILEDYIKIEDKRISIGQLIRSAYLQQILSLLVRAFKGEKVSNYFEKAVKNYIKLFGFDMEISDLIEKAKKLKIELKFDNIEEGDLTKWHLYKLPDKIWEDIE